MALFYVWNTETKVCDHVDGRRVGSSVIHGLNNTISEFWGNTAKEVRDKVKYKLEVRKFALVDELEEIEEALNEFDRRPEPVHARSNAEDNSIRL